MNTAVPAALASPGAVSVRGAFRDADPNDVLRLARAGAGFF